MKDLRISLPRRISASFGHHGIAINHTSDHHGWFQRARKSPPATPERDFYLWSDSPRRFEEARILFKDFETSNWAWDPVAQAYYWHRFYAHQPDLNFDNPLVREAILSVLDFWLRLGVDGVQLDAVPYLFERDGTSCENLPETHASLRELRDTSTRSFRARSACRDQSVAGGRRVLFRGRRRVPHGVSLSPDGTSLHGAANGGQVSIIDILEQTPEIPPNCQWAIFAKSR